jgi:hypothetical protein
MTLIDVQCESASAPALCGSGGGSGRLLLRVCTSNPFYVLSALLVCLGVWVSFGRQTDASQTWALLFGMAGYTLLLAVTGCLLVRFVGVWDDVRTILLLVVLLFLATSVTFDEVLATDPARGITCYLAGLLFAVAVSEGMLRGMRLLLPPLFRVPYYLVLALFFLYPVAITPFLDRPRSETLCWALFGFSPAAGLAFLTLLPAIRRGRDYVRDNGSPWGWAWYPWVLFGVLAFGVGARSALLCWSMHHMPLGQTEPYIFGLYFLVPFGLAIGALLLEIGLFERQRSVLRLALILPAILVFLTVVGHRADPTYQWFLGRLIARLGGTPLFLTVLASVGFYAYAALRRVPSASDALTAAFAALAFVSPHTLGFGDLVPPRMLPVVAIAVLQTAIGLRRHDAWRCLIGAGCAVVSATIGLHEIGAGSHRGPIAFHLILIAVLAVGAAFDGALGRTLRAAGAAMAFFASFILMTGRLEENVPSWVPEVYPLVMSLVIAGYGFMLVDRASLASAGLNLFCWLAALGCRGYASLRQTIGGIDYIAIGMMLFGMAVLTSMAKGGVLPWKLLGRRDKLPNAPE